MKKSDSLEKENRTRLSMILLRGFAVSLSYSDMSRDRVEVALREGISEGMLYAHFERYLKGTPIPGRDPMSDGPKILALMRLAENAGLVTITNVKAEMFIPESGNK